jgi:hypothetical protein
LATKNPKIRNTSVQGTHKIPALRTLRQEDCEFHTTLGYAGRPWREEEGREGREGREGWGEEGRNYLNILR